MGGAHEDTGLPWARGVPPDRHFPPDFLLRGAVWVARQLLGARLISRVDHRVAVGVIVETEAYLGPADPASHAATRTGRTHRNRAMFGPPGRAYVYRSYGVHWCMNVVTGAEGEAEAVLLRGVEPIQGRAVMAERRGGRLPLAAGPGRVCEALGITETLYGHDLGEPPLQLLPGWPVPDPLVAVSGRIGVRLASDWPLRFYVIGSAGVTPHRNGSSAVRSRGTAATG